MMQHSARLLAVTATLALTATGAHAAVTISSGATQNMFCSNGVCAPTADKAVLNVGDLETMLGSGNVTVTTTGSGVQAHDIRVSSALSWASSSALSLEAQRSIALNAAVSATGLSELVLDTGGKNAKLAFGRKGSISFANLSSQLTIDGGAYTLVGDIKTLASDVASNPNGDFALAGNYNASTDGTYLSSPVSTVFAGVFEGLGNIISNLSIDGSTNINGNLLEGLFAEIDTKGTVANVGLVNADIVVPQRHVLAGALVGVNNGMVDASEVSGTLAVGKLSFAAGGLIGENNGTVANSYSTASLNGSKTALGGLVADNGLNAVIKNSYATGDVTGVGSIVGGLLGLNAGGTIENCHATGHVTVTGAVGWAGGLAGQNDAESGTAGTIQDSYATGMVTGGKNSYIGGFAGANAGSIIINSYATGAVAGKSNSEVGGLVGLNGADAATISFSYSTGAVSGGAGSFVGGLLGYDESPGGSITDTYWDTDTSGITNPSQGAGNIPNDPGIAGLTTAQFQSGLPAGFDSAIWAENPNVNGGLPYLLANPPPK